MLLFISILLSILIFSQVIMWVRLESFAKNNKESKELIQRYEGMTTLAKIPKDITYKDIEPDCNTFYNFMENIKLENWNAEVIEDRVGRDSWSVNIISHDDKSVLSSRIRDYGQGVFLASCSIRTGGTSLSIGKEDKIANDVIIFLWDYIIKHYEERNLNDTEYYNQIIQKINAELKTLNRTQRLNNILNQNI